LLPNKDLRPAILRGVEIGREICAGRPKSKDGADLPPGDQKPSTGHRLVKGAGNPPFGAWATPYLEVGKKFLSTGADI